MKGDSMFTKLSAKLIVLVILGGFIYLHPVAKAVVLPLCDFEWDFYSDATFTNQVGTKVTDCRRGVILSGTETSYYNFFNFGQCLGAGGNSNPNANCHGADFRCIDGVEPSGASCPTF
jgi:Family of unknown function (DUF6289)